MNKHRLGSCTLLISVLDNLHYAKSRLQYIRNIIRDMRNPDNSEASDAEQALNLETRTEQLSHWILEPICGAGDNKFLVGIRPKKQDVEGLDQDYRPMRNDLREDGDMRFMVPDPLKPGKLTDALTWQNVRDLFGELLDLTAFTQVKIVHVSIDDGDHESKYTTVAIEMDEPEVDLGHWAQVTGARAVM